MTTDRLAPGNVLPTAVMPMNTAVFDGICDKALICDDVATAAVWPAGIVSVSRSSLFWLFPDDGQHFHYAFSHRSRGIYGSVANHPRTGRFINVALCRVPLLSVGLGFTGIPKVLARERVRSGI